MNIFKKIDAFLNASVDYFDNRVITGKFIYDIKYYIEVIIEFFVQISKKLYEDTRKTNVFIALFNLLKTLWQLLMKIKLFAMISSFIADTIKLIISCYAEIFITFAFTFPLTIVLLNFFQTAIIAFFVSLIPILLLNTYCVSALFNFIKHKQDGEKISLWQSFHMLVPRFSAIIFPSITESAIIQELIFAFILIALFLSFTFGLVNISWSSSFIYWFIVLFLLFLLVISIFVLSMVMNQTYFTILMENISFKQAFKSSKAVVSSFSFYYFIFYFLIYLLFGFIIWKAAVYYLYLGITLGLYGTCIVTTFLGFWLWKKFQIPPMQEATVPSQKPPLLITVLIVFGFINYILLSIFFIQEYQPLTTFIQQQEDNFLASQDMKPYSNNTYGYAVQYPQSWTVYAWNDKSTTFYNNYTGTISGGTWMTISVSSYDDQDFEQLFAAEPGGVANVDTPNTITTKITNMSIQGYDTVNYSIIKKGNPYPQYETHYLIHKGNLLYDIAFISVTNDVANYDSDLFQTIINSFQFTQ